MSELRLNLITGDWVVILNERAKKPEDFRRRRETHFIPEYLDSCPFCRGNEDKTPHDIMRLPAEGDWQMRVTPNKFSILQEEGDRNRFNQGMKHSISGVGRHEIIVESPFHNLSLAQLPVGQVKAVLDIYKDRFIDAFQDTRVRHAIIFKNHGLRSGTSIMHPHSQLVGMPVVPMQVRNRVDEAMRYFDHTGECIVCSTLNEELRDGSRIIVDSKHFVSFIPYAALSPFHTWIFPRSHAQSFSCVDDEAIEDLAFVLKTTLGKMYYGLDNPDFNLTIRSLSPFRGRSEYIHWYMSIVLNVASTSGFEMGSGMHVNPSMPEKVAEFLRNVKES